MKKLLKFTLALGLVAALVIPGGVALAAASLTNASFESGDTTGWTATIPSGASISVVTSYLADPTYPVPYYGPTYTAQEGSYFAILKTDGPGQMTKLSQSVAVSAGDTISGWAFYDARDYSPYVDWAEVVILDNTMALVASVFYSDTSAVGDYGETPWTAWSHTFAAAGTYTVEARVANFGDSIVDSYMGFDVEFMPTVSTSLTGPVTVDVGQLASWTLNVQICPGQDYSDDVIVQGGIGADLVVTMVEGDTVEAGEWVATDHNWKKSWTHNSLPITLTKNGKPNKMGATIVTWDVGDLTAGNICQDIDITFETGLNPKGKQEFTSAELGHELDGGFSASFMYYDVEYETPETAPQTVDVEPA